MKKVKLIPLVILISASSAWAQQHPETARDNTDNRVSVSAMNEHERAILAHESMDNANSAAHQSIIDMHRKMMLEEK